MIVSTFELLVKPQLPKNLPGDLPDAVKEKIERLRRTVTQGYFLTIANLSPVDIFLSLAFTVKLPSGMSINDLIAFLDTTGGDVPDLSGRLQPVPDSNKFIYSPLPLVSQNTALFLLQPDFVSKPQLLSDANFEVRGFVEVLLTSFPSGVSDVTIQVTPEHRGTFFSNLTGDGSAGRDQIAYSLPVQNGGLFTFKAP